ncbi:hypothetical protein ILUMI_24135 [Ignelater luminosus]|uniref:Uncharacterized protein n=1 Tax=Ignelater luminosus TaxID=2038154 RepID=A0A8K0C6T9_IGNLU|nr:hypothetical protein ILUMI_24135 [Ignelater luminosus]
MGRKQVDPVVQGRVLELLNLKSSEIKIISQVRKDNIKILRATICRIKKRKDISGNNKKKSNRKRWYVLNNRKIHSLKEMTASINPPTQKNIAKRLKCSQHTIWYHIHNTLKLPTRKKGYVHWLTGKQILKRKQMSLKLYRLLNKSKWTKIITSKKTWFYIDNCNG